MGEGYEKYLEGDYDIGRAQEQVKKDHIRAKEIEAQIEEEQNRLRSQAIKQVAKEKGILEVNTDDEDSFYNEYVNKEREYLVDGAVLQCDQATWDDFPVRGETRWCWKEISIKRKNLVQPCVHMKTQYLTMDLYSQR